MPHVMMQPVRTTPSWCVHVLFVMISKDRVLLLLLCGKLMAGNQDVPTCTADFKPMYGFISRGDRCIHTFMSAAWTYAAFIQYFIHSLCIYACTLGLVGPQRCPGTSSGGTTSTCSLQCRTLWVIQQHHSCCTAGGRTQDGQCSHMVCWACACHNGTLMYGSIHYPLPISLRPVVGRVLCQWSPQCTKLPVPPHCPAG